MLRVTDNVYKSKIYLQYNQYNLPISYTTTYCKTKIQRSANVQMHKESYIHSITHKLKKLVSLYNMQTICMNLFNIKEDCDITVTILFMTCNTVLALSHKRTSSVSNIVDRHISFA